MPDGREGNGPRGRSSLRLMCSQKQRGHSWKSLSVEAESCGIGMGTIVRQGRDELKAGKENRHDPHARPVPETRRSQWELDKATKAPSEASAAKLPYRGWADCEAPLWGFPMRFSSARLPCADAA